MTVDFFSEIKWSWQRCGSNVRFFAAELSRKSLKRVARPERFELPTLWFEARCSIQLSYGRTSGECTCSFVALQEAASRRGTSASNWQRTAPPGISAVLLGARDCQDKTSAFRLRERAPLGSFLSCSIE